MINKKQRKQEQEQPLASKRTPDSSRKTFHVTVVAIIIYKYALSGHRLLPACHTYDPEWSVYKYHPPLIFFTSPLNRPFTALPEG